MKDTLLNLTQKGIQAGASLTINTFFVAKGLAIFTKEECKRTVRNGKNVVKAVQMVSEQRNK